jgi:octaprenyl-diphosphate synthase
MRDSLARERSAPSAPLSLPEVYSLVRKDLDEIEKRLVAIERPDVPRTAEIMDHVLSLQGKRVRPLLLLLVTRLSDAADREDVLWASTVVELVHTATLLHDDCLDGTSLRRGVPTVNHRWDPHSAILMGDYLFTKAFDLLCEHGLYAALRILTFHTFRMTCGMNREFAGRRDARLPLEEYLRIIDEKTAALFVSSCEIGAVLAELPETTATALSEFSRDLGSAFQVIDDVFDFTGDPAAIGKPVGTDFKLGFATLPLIHALKEGDTTRGRQVAEWFSRGDVTEEEWTAARQFVIDSGGVDAAKEKARALATSARERLSTLTADLPIGPLLATAETMIARSR